MNDDIDIEDKKIKTVKFIVDLTQAILMQSDLTLTEATQMIEDTKRAVLRLFPDKGEVYELIYTPRFRRIIAERFFGKGVWH